MRSDFAFCLFSLGASECFWCFSRRVWVFVCVVVGDVSAGCLVGVLNQWVGRWVIVVGVYAFCCLMC